MVESGQSLHRFAVLVAVSTLVLLFAGGLVTSTGSGLSVPDWPLSYGQFFPRMTGGILFEHGHLMVAATVGLLTIVLAVWLWQREPRKWVRRLGGLSVLIIMCQGLLGGITVLFLLPTAVSVAHAALAEIFFCLMVSLALFTSRTWRDADPSIDNSGWPSLRFLTTTTTVVIYTQILIGALIRHTGAGLAIPDFPLAFGRMIPPVFTRQILVNFAHRIGAATVTFFVLWVSQRIFRLHRSENILFRMAALMVTALLIQIFLGAETVWTGRAVAPTTLHVAAGALTLGASLSLTLMAYRLTVPASAVQPVHAPRQNAQWSKS